jgi:hypothetical protein
LCELELPHQARAQNEGCDTAIYTIVRRTFRQGRAISRPAADHAAALYVRSGVARV